MATTSGAPGMKLVRTKDLTALMTCPICSKIQRNATTISECLHTFCKRCIYRKIIEEDLNSCPVCKTDLGCTPLDKLRPDHNMRSLTTRIFASFKKNTKEPDAQVEAKKMEIIEVDDEEPDMPSIPMPIRRKERSLSSLVTTPKVDKKPPSGRRKSISRKDSSFVANEEPVRKVEELPEGSSTPMTSKKIAQNKRQSNLSRCSKQQASGKDTEQSGPLEGMTDLWKPLNYLVEAAGITKASKSSSQGIVFKSPAPIIQQDKANLSKGKGKECANKSNYDKGEDKANVSKGKGKECANKSTYDNGDDDAKEHMHGSTPGPPVPVKPLKRKPRGRPKGSVAANEGVRVCAQTVVDAPASERRINSIWLSLVAACNQNEGPPLPQIPSCYLRIKDVHLPVSFIKKYLVRKLDLESEDEVEIDLHGHTIPSDMDLYSLVHMWAQTTAPLETITTTVGSSAKDFVMVLSYSRKA